MGMLFVFIPRVSLRLPWAMCLLGLQPTLPKSETLVGNHSCSNKRKWGGGSRLRGWVDDRCSMEGASELCQQSIAESTHFFSTTDIFGRNTPFSERFRNSLTLKRLCSLRIAQHSAFNRPHYKTCLFAMRNMPIGNAKDAKRWCG